MYTKCLLGNQANSSQAKENDWRKENARNVNYKMTQYRKFNKKSVTIRKCMIKKTTKSSVRSHLGHVLRGGQGGKWDTLLHQQIVQCQRKNANAICHRGTFIPEVAPNLTWQSMGACFGMSLLYYLQSNYHQRITFSLE